MRLERAKNILTADSGMQNVLKIAENVAGSRAPVLIQGESGTGKELLARLIHEKSHRSEQRLIAINCAAVPEGLLESELFGFEKGAFTGAIQSKIGKFELANNSTILLDEIGEMPLALQSKLLRILQEGEFERIGSNRPQKVDVRIVSTTNRDLASMVREKNFREDLFYRLNVIPVVIPPLRDRPTDIRLIATHLIERVCAENSKALKRLSSESMEKLLAWSWPGNVRELENILERAVLLTESEEIPSAALGIEIKEAMTGPRDRLSAGMTVSEAERALIMKTLDFTAQNRTHAAKMLGISIRTLRNKLSEYRREESL